MFKKVWKRIAGFFFSLMIILAILLAVLRLAGLRPFIVTSGSMSPAYPVGSMIYVRRVDAGSVKMGDAITFFLDGTAVATHRVVDIDLNHRFFYTKGDANDTADGSPVLFDDIIGVPVFCVPLLGYVSYFVTHPPGLYLVLAAAVVIVLLTFYPARTHARGVHRGDPVEEEPRSVQP